MSSKLGGNFSQFGIKHLIFVILTFSVSLAIYAMSSEWGKGLVLAVAVFWSGLGLVALADSIDDRPVDERTRVSQAMGLIGSLMVVGSFFLAAFWTLIVLVGILND